MPQFHVTCLPLQVDQTVTVATHREAADQCQRPVLHRFLHTPRRYPSPDWGTLPWTITEIPEK